MRRDVAEKITSLIMEYQGKLNASVLLVQSTCSDEEFQAYRRAVGRATDFMFMELTRALQTSSPQDDYEDQTQIQIQKMLV